MTAKDLKNALLQEAVQGKLVPQIASEGNARDLLEEIRKAKGESAREFCKAKLGSERKRTDNAPMEISEDEIPFDIPESWCWCRLGDISYKITDGEHKTPNRVNNFCGYYLLSARNILNGSISLDKVDYVDATEYEKISKRCNPVKGDVLISCSGSVGRSAVVNDNNHYVMVRSAAMTRPIINDSFFIMYCIQSPCLQEQIQESIKQAVQANLFQEAIRNLLIPLPPLAEQKRIVAAIEKFMPLIEEYGKKETVLNELNAQIGTLTKKAILQEAVQGKLVPQIPSEGNAKDLLEQIKAQKAALIKEGKIKKDKPLPEITEDEIPFDIPENWCWCRLGEIVNKLTDGTHRTPKYVEKGIPFLSVKNLSSGKMDFENTKFITPEEHKELYARCNPEKGDMLLTKVGTTGIPVINDSDIEFSLFVSVALLKFSHEYINEKYFLYLLQSPLVKEQAQENTKGVGNKNWVMDAIAKTVLVLPPLSEQKRIVAAIEQLLPLCNGL